jgi:hypothetical protein
MKVSTENDNNFGYEKIMIVVDNIPLIEVVTKAGLTNLIEVNKAGLTVT